jgi:LAS superfamily LD-carboxypeptidase LdcB
VQLDAPRFAAHPDAAAAFVALRAAARDDGFDLKPVSSFRDHRMQLRIWNNKFSGKAPLYDIDGNIRDRAGFTEDDTIRRILDWSALPGASRHQWGTEIDVVDGNAMPPGYAPKLLPEEVRAGGMFAPLHHWLDEHLERFDFFRPYARFQGGMYPEPWHLSYAPVSLKAINDLDIDLLAELTRDSAILGKARILALLPEIFERHVRNIFLPGPAQRPRAWA